MSSTLQVIVAPGGLTAQEQLDYIEQAYSTYFGKQTAGSTVVIEISPTGAAVNIPTPSPYTPAPQAPYPPVTTTGQDYTPPLTLPQSHGFVAAPGTTNAMTFKLFSGGTYSWGSPIGLPNGSIIMGGNVSGTNVVASTSDAGVSWAIIGYPYIEIQSMAIGPTGYPNRVVGRDAGEANYVQSDDYGVTWVPSSYSGWLGTGSNGFYS